MGIQTPTWAGRCVLALAGVVLAGVLAPAASAHRIEKRFPVELRPTISIRNKSGKVVIKSWKKNEVLVVANHVSEKTEVDATQAGNRIDIITHLLTENVAPGELVANFDVMVPEEATIQIENGSGDVFVESISGDMSFDTVAAGVDLKEVAGYLVIKTMSGSLTCYLCAGRIEVNTISGNLSFVNAVSSNIRAKTYTGNIFFDGRFERGGRYELSNYSGLIEVRFSEGDSFDLKASSVQGKVENQAKLRPPAHNTFTRPSDSRVAGILSGTQNLGLARVELGSFSGTIKVLKRSEN